MNEKSPMLHWAESRCRRCAKAARQANNALQTAQRDLDSIRAGEPTSACLSRYTGWKSRQPKTDNKEKSK